MSEVRDPLYDEQTLWKLWGLIVLAPIVAMAIHAVLPLIAWWIVSSS